MHASNILELEVEAETPKPHIPREESSREFLDPAIVSYGRYDIQNVRQPIGAPANGGTPSAGLRSQPALGHPSHELSTIHAPTVVPATTDNRGITGKAGLASNKENIPTSATLSGPFSDLSLNGQMLGEALNAKELTPPIEQDFEVLRIKEVPSGQVANNNNKRRKSAVKGSVSTQTQTLPGSQPPITPLSSQKRRSKQQKGWRQTPLLSEPAAIPNYSHKPSATMTSDTGLKPPPTRNSKVAPAHLNRRTRRRQKQEEDQNGWATGEVSDIQEMGDFDFEENLSKFDKRKVFDQIRLDDTTADEARLVSFNRLPKPGTAGGKNLHYTENVLDSPVHRSVGHSSDSDLAVSETKMSRTSTRHPPSRKGSALVAGDHHGSGSTFVTDSVGMARQRSSHSRAASPKVRTDSSTGRHRTSTTAPKPSLRFSSTNRQCPTISPLQMLEIEQLAISELGLTEEMMAETAARSIAETAYHLSTTEDEEHPGHWSVPLIVVLAGNHKTGSRAIAAARHLRNHGARVVLCVLGVEREDDLLDSVRRQLKILRNCGGQAIKQDTLMRTLRKLHAPTDLIIDALLGMHISFDDLRTDDQAAYFQLVMWANSNTDALILSIDIPSGIDASSGLLTTQDGHPLHLHAANVLSLGAPKMGLLSALARVEGVGGLGLYVADIGISPNVWKKFGTRRRHGVEFGGEWVVALVFDGGGGEGDDGVGEGEEIRWL